MVRVSIGAAPTERKHVRGCGIDAQMAEHIDVLAKENPHPSQNVRNAAPKFHPPLRDRSAGQFQWRTTLCLAGTKPARYKLSVAGGVLSPGFMNTY